VATLAPGGALLATAPMFTGTALFDVLLPPDSRSLKAKRSYVRPVVAALRRLDVSAAEVGDVEVHGRSQLGVATVAADAHQVRDVLDSCERLVAGRPELELLGVRRQLFSDTD
jgi:uncharacterized protein YlxP (DUF503 family)